MTARLALLRHGHTPWNRAGRIQGRTDIDLDAAARHDLAALSLPAPWQAAALCASPLRRAQDTAEIVTGRKPKLVTVLTEMDWGAWEGLHGADLRADPGSRFRDIENWGWDYRPPDGESPRDLRERLTPWLATLTGDTVAVTHMGVMRTLLAMATGWDFDGTCPFSIKRNRLYVLEKTDETWRLWPQPVRLVAKRPS